jgi:hypothetical protein
MGLNSIASIKVTYFKRCGIRALFVVSLLYRYPTQHTANHSRVLSLSLLHHACRLTTIPPKCYVTRIFKSYGMLRHETSVTLYQSVRRNIPGDFNLQQYRCKTLKLRKLSPVICVGEKREPVFMR